MDDNTALNVSLGNAETREDESLVETEYAAEYSFLAKLNQNILGLQASSDPTDIELLNELAVFAHERGPTRSSIENFLFECNNGEKQTSDEVKSTTSTMKRNTHSFETIPVPKERLEATAKKLSSKLEQCEQLAFEKKKIIKAIIESSSSTANQTSGQQSNNTKKSSHTSLATRLRHEPLNKYEETQVLANLNQLLSDNSDSAQHQLSKPLLESKQSALRRLRCKLQLRSLKRALHLNLLDIDSYTNELMDNEKASARHQMQLIKAEKLHQEQQHDQYHLQQQQQQTASFKDAEQDDDNDDDDIIFDQEVLKTSLDGDNDACQIVAVVSVLDRFKRHWGRMHKMMPINNFNCYYSYEDNDHHHHHHQANRIPSIGIVESRNDDIKCVISPLSNK